MPSGDATFAARLYCAVVGATLIALALAAWNADRSNPYIGALLGGTGLFLVAGTFGRATRLTAMLSLCALFAGGAFVSGLGFLVLALAIPTFAQLGVLAIKLVAALLAISLARRMYRQTP
jgi:hypothetical protein